MSVAGLFSVQGFAGSELSDQEKQAIAERIKPVGTVCVDNGKGCGDEPAAADAPATTAVAAAQAPAASAGKSGEEIYNTKCAACHGAGIAGAPKVGDAAQWEKRIAQGNDTLHEHALKGFNAMPAKGMCMDCSDDEIKATVDYMVNQSK